MKPAARAGTAGNGGSLTAHVSWLMVAKTAGYIFNLALPILVVRRLNLVQFGIYKQLFLMIATSVAVLQLGFGMSAYFFLPREPDRRPEVIFNICAFNTLIGGLACGTLILFPSLLGLTFDQPALARYGPLMGLVILLWMLASPLEIIPIASGEMKLASAMIVSVQLTRTAMYLGAVIVFGTVRALMYAAVVQGVLQTGVLGWYLQSRFRGFWRRLDTGLLRHQLSYALPLGLAGILYTVQTDLHNYFVSNRLGAAAFGLYAIGTLQLPLTTLLQEATNAVLIPRVSYLQHLNDTRAIVSLIARAARKLAAVYFPIYALLIGVAPELISFFFTRRFLASVPVFRINLTLLLVSILLQDPLFRAYESQRFFLVRLRIFTCTLLVAGLWFGTTRFGPVGAITVVVAVNVIERAITAVRFGHILGVGWQDIGLLKDVMKLGIAAAAALLVTAAVRVSLAGARPLITLLVCGAVFSLVYLAFVMFEGVPTTEEKELVLAQARSLLRLPPRLPKPGPAPESRDSESVPPPPPRVSA
ncbi:MAG TPA: oligosaccharide flippase family protein [Bryobacteraceae bacterium]|nr:oligosaccharide flippase family protein [Bryobacteraceae bacterium]